MLGEPRPAEFRTPSLPRTASALAGACAALVAATGLVVLLGWIADIAAIRQVVPASPDMKPVAAVGFVVCGVALWLVRRPDVRPQQMIASRLLGGTVAAMGVWVIAEYVWGGTLLDLLLFRDLVIGEGVTYPGRPSPHTAVAFIACGLAIALLDADARRRYWPSRVLVPAAALVSLAALVGYLYGADYLYGVAGVSGMAIHTCAAFLVLACGIAVARPSREPVRTFVSAGVGGRLARQLAPLLLVVPAIATTMRLLGQDAHASPTGLAFATVALVAAAVVLCARTARSFDNSNVRLHAAGEQLRHERDYSAAIVASLEDGLVVTSPGGEVRDVSDSFLELSGFSRPELIGATPPLPWWPPDHEEQIAAFSAETITEGGRASQDLFLQRASGGLVPVIATRQAVLDSHGDVRVHVVTFKDNTERFIAERAIREAEEQFRTIFDDAPSGMAILSLRHRFVRVNRAFAEMTGYAPEDLFGMTAAGLTHPDDRDADATAFAAVIAGEKRSARRRKRYLRTDGQTVWVELHETLVRDVDGQPVHVVTQGRDITAEAAAIAAREQAEAELRASEQRFRTLSLQAPIGIFESDARGRTTWMNDRWYELTGLNPAQAAGDGWTDALHPHDHERVLAAWRHATSTGTDFELEYRFQRPDGTIVWVASRATPLYGPDGTPIGWLGTADDITARRAQEQALRESDERFRTALDANADGFYVLQARRDASGEIVDFIVEELNEAGAKLFGRSRDESVGSGMIEQFGEVFRDSGIWQRYCMVCETRASTDEELELPTPDGGMAWFSVRMAPLGDGLVISSRDITERRNAELALRESEERFRVARDTSLDSFCLLEAVRDQGGAICDFRVTEINAVGARLAGRTRDELLACPVSEIAPDTPEMRALFSRYCAVRETGAPLDEEFRFPMPDGHERWFSHQIVRLGDGVAVSTRDITERKSIQIALQQAEALFRTVFESAPVGMVLIDTGGAVLSANAAALTIFGSDEANFIGSRPLDVTHPDDFAPTNEALARLLRGEDDEFTVDARYVHTSGRTVWCRVTATLVRNAAGAPAYFLAQFQDITDGHAAQERLQWMADHDPLTGALNRRRLEQEIERHIAFTDRYGARGALLMLDIDHFKYVNDTLGHQRGDDLIKRVSTLIHNRLRSSDVIARLGGDEFAVLLPQGGEAEARQVADSICRAIAEGAALSDPEQAVRITTSIGVALFTGASDSTPDDMLVNADIAMYDAKETGRNGVCVYQPGKHQQERMRSGMNWAQRIRDALAGDGFELFLQPILDLRTDRVTQHEVLLRLREPGGELVPPAAFLFVAERFDLIQEIDRHVARRAIRIAAERQHAGSPIVLGVNLSGKSIGDPALLAMIEHDLAETGVDAGNLVFEVTETAAVANLEQARAFAERLRELGCRFALDDFGAGFGSFYYLKHLPFDYLKIDGEFIRNAVTNPTDQLVIRALVDIARGLGKRTIAEFVEDDETLSLLRESGVDFAQGYCIGRPRPLAEALDAASVPHAA